MRLRRVGVAACLAVALPTLPALASPGAGGADPLAPAESFARAEVAHYSTDVPASFQAVGTGVEKGCFSSAESHVDPATSNGSPTNPAWYERDALNQYCATLRLRDQAGNPAYGLELAQQGDALWLQQLADQVSGTPGHIHGGITTLLPGSQAADSLRTVDQWEARTGGRVIPVKFAASDGAQLEGNVWLPPPGTPLLPSGRYPGVVITDGSVQGYQNLYYWAAEGLAQYGYEVLTYDVQGQGDSDAFPGGCPNVTDPSGCTTGVPYQQNYKLLPGRRGFAQLLPLQPCSSVPRQLQPGLGDSADE